MRSIAPDLLMQRWTDQRRSQPRAPVNRALYECLRQAIREGTLPASSRLPPTRDLAAQLEISRNTVTHAYEQLLAEGYLRTRVGSGTFVAAVLPDRMLWSGSSVTNSAKSVAVASGGGVVESQARLSHRGQVLIETAAASAVQWGAFVPGVPDVTMFPHRKFAQISARLWRKPDPELLSYSSGGGHSGLRRELATHLRQARSVNCDPDQIVITEGVHQAVDLTARLLADAGDKVWVEEPGYWGIRSVLLMNGLRVEAVPVDAEGMAPEAGQRGAPPKLVFVTPSHQYPLGSVMSLSRRQALLAYATRRGSWIVEDDYDSEFRFSGYPIPSLQGLVDDAPVIYIGTFSKTLYPGLRIAFMVLPRRLAARFATARSELYREGHLMTQAAVASFMEAGLYAAHIRRMRLVYATRRQALIALVEKWLGPQWLHPLDTNAGLHVVLSLPEWMDDVAVSHAAQRHGVIVRPLSRYYAGSRRESGLLLGFACLPERDMLAPFEVLVACLKREHAASKRLPTLAGLKRMIV